MIGKDYRFISKDIFSNMINESSFYEYNTFDNHLGDTWYYGSTNEDFDSSQVFIKTPSGVNQIKPDDRKKCFIVYLDISEDIRRNRLLERKDFSDSIDRRILADDKDFENFNDYDLKISDEDFDPDMVFGLME